MKKKISMAVAVASIGVFAPGPAQAVNPAPSPGATCPGCPVIPNSGHYRARRRVITTDALSYAPGSTITFYLSDFQARERVRVTIAGRKVIVRTDANGNATGTITMPSRAGKQAMLRACGLTKSARAFTRLGVIR